MAEPRTERCLLLGGGGHAGVVIDALQLSGVNIHGILDANPSLWNNTVFGIPILGSDDLLHSLKSAGISAFVVSLGSVGRDHNRARLFALARGTGLSPLTVIHPSATCSKWAKVGAGTVVLANAVVNAGAEVGVNAIVNSGAIVEHDCSIGDHVHVASGARLSGGVRVGENAFVGAGATLRQGVSIGREAVVGAGAVVVRDVDSGSTVVGVPARPRGCR